MSVDTMLEGEPEIGSKHIMDKNKILLTLDSFVDVKVKVMLRTMVSQSVSRPVYLGVKHPSGPEDQIFITVRQLWICCRGAPSLTRGRVCLLQLLLGLAS
jgi:hypothetical protein